MSRFNKVSVVIVALVGSTALVAQNRTVKLNGGLEAEMLTIGRDASGYNLSASIRIANKGKSTAYLLLLGEVVATDNTGGTYNLLVTISGIGSCALGYATCSGNPTVVNTLTPPLQAYTQIDPDVEITINLRLNGQRSNGPLVSLSANVLFRLVGDQIKDDTLSDAEKRKQVKLMSLSFPAMSVTEAK